MDTTLVTIFDTVHTLVYDTAHALILDTARVAMIDTVVVGGGLEKDGLDILIPIFTVVTSMWIGWCLARRTAQVTVEESRNEANRRMKNLTSALKAELGEHRNQIFFVNDGEETIRNAIGYIEIELDRASQIFFKEQLDEARHQRAYIDEMKSLGRTETEIEGPVTIKTPLCWSMGEYVGGTVGVRNPGVTNIRPGERRGLSVFDIETNMKSSKPAIQIPSEFGYSTILEDPKMRSSVFLHFPEVEKSYKAKISLFSDNTNVRVWETTLQWCDNSRIKLTDPMPEDEKIPLILFLPANASVEVKRVKLGMAAYLHKQGSLSVKESANAVSCSKSDLIEYLKTVEKDCEKDS